MGMKLSDFEHIQMVAMVEASGTGTKVFQSCLDGADEVITIPAYPLVYLYPNFLEWKKTYGRKLDWVKFVDLLSYNHSSLYDSNNIPGFNGLTQLGSNKDESISIDEEIFKKTFFNLTNDLPVTMRNALSAIHISYQVALGNSMENVKCFLFHLHNDIYLEHLFKDFPHAKVIGFIRDPRPNVKKRTTTGWKIDTEKLNLTDAILHRPRVYPNLCTYFFFNIYNIYQYADVENIRIVKHEDLYYDLEGKMHSVCNWLGLTFSPIMLELTFNKLPWWSDKLYGGEQTNKVAKSTVSDSWKKEISPRDWFVIEAISKDLFKKYDYKLEKYKDTFLEKAKAALMILLPTALEISSSIYLLNIKTLILFFKHCLDEVNSPNKLVDYSFSATYRHKWDYKPMKFSEEFLLRRKVKSGTSSQLSKVLYIGFQLLRYAWAVITIPVQIMRRQLIMLSLLFKTDVFKKLPLKF